MAALYDIYVDKGTDFFKSLDVTGNFTDFTISVSILDSTDTAIASTIVWTDDTLGKMDLSITNVNTSLMATGVGKYNVEVVSPTAKRYRLLQGRVYIDGDVA